MDAPYLVVDLAERDLGVVSIDPYPYTLAQGSTPGGARDLTCVYL